MPMYLIERTVPGAHSLNAEERANLSTASCDVLEHMGPGIRWLQSYVTEDKITCIYEADSEDLVHEHGQKGGFPVTKISQITSVLEPALGRR